MSFTGTLAKIALGYAAARGVDALASPSSGPLSGSLGLTDTGEPEVAPDGFGDIFGGGFTTGIEEDASTGFGGVVDRLSSGAGGDGDGDLLGLAELVGMLGLAGGAVAATTSLGDILSGHIDTGRPAPEEEAKAKLLLRAMIEAAKSDGVLSMQEKQRILGTLTDATPGEVNFVTAQMQAPPDLDGLVRDTPSDLARQVYSAALMTIRPDTPAETKFLARLGQALELTAAEMDSLHRQRKAVGAGR